MSSASSATSGEKQWGAPRHHGGTGPSPPSSHEAATRPGLQPGIAPSPPPISSLCRREGPPESRLRGNGHSGLCPQPPGTIGRLPLRLSHGLGGRRGAPGGTAAGATGTLLRPGVGDRGPAGRSGAEGSPESTTSRGRRGKGGTPLPSTGSPRKALLSRTQPPPRHRGRLQGGREGDYGKRRRNKAGLLTAAPTHGRAPKPLSRESPPAGSAGAGRRRRVSVHTAGFSPLQRNGWPRPQRGLPEEVPTWTP